MVAVKKPTIKPERKTRRPDEDRPPTLLTEGVYLIPSDAPAPCREDPHLFDSVSEPDAQLARAICRTCPSIDLCKLSFQSMPRYDRIRYAGTWGGRSWKLAGVKQIEMEDRWCANCGDVPPTGPRTELCLDCRVEARKSAEAERKQRSVAERHALREQQRAKLRAMHEGLAEKMTSP